MSAPKFYLLEPAIFGPPGVKAPQFASFHGQGDRNRSPGGPVPCYLGCSDVPTLQIDRDGTRIPHIFKPEMNLVVSSSVAERLKVLPNVEFKSVSFRKLVKFHVLKGDMSVYEKDFYFDPRRWVRRANDVPKFHRGVGDFYELVIARHQDIVSRFIGLRSVLLRPSEFTTRRGEEYATGLQLLQQYPIHSFSGVILSEHVFSLLKSDLDFDYFGVQEYQVP